MAKRKNQKTTDISPVSVDLYFIPVETRVPLKFGPETLTSVICARACMTVANKQGQKAQGWGETPLSVQYEGRIKFKDFLTVYMHKKEYTRCFGSEMLVQID